VPFPAPLEARVEDSCTQAVQQVAATAQPAHLPPSADLPVPASSTKVSRNMCAFFPKNCGVYQCCDKGTFFPPQFPPH
jgi:hypothetical protein